MVRDPAIYRSPRGYPPVACGHIGLRRRCSLSGYHAGLRHPDAALFLYFDFYL